jgi:ribosomal protein L35
MSKTRKSFLKRFKVTKKGKILKYSPGKSHFLIKKSSKILRKKRKISDINEIVLEYKNY